MRRRFKNGFILFVAIWALYLPAVSQAADRYEEVVVYFAMDSEAKRVLCQRLAEKNQGYYEPMSSYRYGSENMVCAANGRDDKNLPANYVIDSVECGSGEAARSGSTVKIDKVAQAGEDHAYAAEAVRVRQILRGLSEMAGADSSGWSILLIPGTKINAYALPGEIFVVSTEAMSRLRDDELEVLLAHELGHQLLGHPIKAMRYSALSKGKLRQAYQYINKNNILQASDYYIEAMELSVVSKRQERQADVWAAELLRQSGRNMQVAVDLWQKLEKLYGKVPNDSNHLGYRERQKIYAPSHAGE